MSRKFKPCGCGNKELRLIWDLTASQTVEFLEGDALKVGDLKIGGGLLLRAVCTKCEAVQEPAAE